MVWTVPRALAPVGDSAYLRGRYLGRVDTLC